MTSETPDMLYGIAVEEEEFEMLIIASIQTLDQNVEIKNVEMKKFIT